MEGGGRWSGVVTVIADVCFAVARGDTWAAYADRYPIQRTDEKVLRDIMMGGC